MTRYDSLSQEAQVLAQALHDAREALGFDTDGDTTPAASIAGMGVQGYARIVVEDVRQQRRDEDEAAEEYLRLERITRGLYDALSVIVENPEIKAAILGPLYCGGDGNRYGDPKAIDQAQAARAAYEAAYPSGLMPGVQPSDVL